MICNVTDSTITPHLYFLQWIREPGSKSNFKILSALQKSFVAMHADDRVQVRDVASTLVTGLRNSVQRRLIVYAYFRSGSTLSGQVFNYNPTSFYWYEPLAGICDPWWGWGKLQPRNFFHFDNGTEKCVRLSFPSYYYYKI